MAHAFREGKRRNRNVTREGRMHSTVRSGVLACVAGVVLLSGCTASEDERALDPDVVHLQAGAPGKPNVVLTQAPAEQLALGSPFSDADVGFMRDMQVHHEQALAMTAMVEERTEREDLRLFVQRMDISQTGELEQLERLLDEHEQAVERTGGDHEAHSGHTGDGDHSDMPGMLTDEQLAVLEAARGDDFARQVPAGHDPAPRRRARHGGGGPLDRGRAGRPAPVRVRAARRQRPAHRARPHGAPVGDAAARLTAKAAGPGVDRSFVRTSRRRSR